MWLLGTATCGYGKKIWGGYFWATVFEGAPLVHTYRSLRSARPKKGFVSSNFLKPPKYPKQYGHVNFLTPFIVNVGSCQQISQHFVVPWCSPKKRTTKNILCGSFDRTPQTDTYRVSNINAYRVSIYVTPFISFDDFILYNSLFILFPKK